MSFINYNMCLNYTKRFSIIFNKHVLYKFRIPQSHITGHNNCILRLLSSNVYERLEKRGLFCGHFPDTENIDKLLSRKRTVYAGFDATNDSLHAGNLLVLLALMHLRTAGHRIIVIIGDATAMIGDPSGKTHDRDEMQYDRVKSNAAAIELEIRRIFENHEKYFCKEKERKKLGEYLILNNDLWYKDMNVIKFLSNVGRKLRIGDMISKKTIKDRLETTGLNFCEFSYQIFQAYDWLYLNQKYGCDFQIGGIDQCVNMHHGYNLIKYINDSPSYAVYLPLITNEDGNKFGKSEGNAIYLNPNRITPYHFYQRLHDTEIHKFLKLFSFRSDEEIEQMYQHQLKSPEPWYLQKKLAKEVTHLVHGEDGLNSAKRTTDVLYSNDILKLGQLSESEINDVFEGASKCTLLFDPNSMTALDLIIKSKCIPNEKLALSVIKRGGFYINYARVASPNQIITEKDILPNDITLIRVGKRDYHIIKWY